MRTLAPLLLLAMTSVLFTSAANAQPVVPVTYQGRLLDGGSPFTGTADLRFALFDRPEDGLLVAGPFEALGVAVADGLLSSEIPLDTSGLEAETYWLEVSVRSGGGAYQTLTPRQPYNPAALSIQSAGAEIEPDGTNVLGRGRADLSVASNTGGTLSTTVVSAWQSFVPTQTGPLSRLSVDGELVQGTSVRIRLFEGAGTGGTELLDESADLGGGIIETTATDGVELIAGASYTIEVEASAFLGAPRSVELDYTTDDSYPQGTSSLIPSTLDLQFEVSIDTPGPADVFVTPDQSFFALKGATIDDGLTVIGEDTRSTDVVSLPDDSIEADEILDEPKVASGNMAAAPVTLSFAQPTGLLVRGFISPPAPGYVIATATLEIQPVVIAASSSDVELTIDSPTAGVTGSYAYMHAGRPRGGGDDAVEIVTVHGLFRVDTTESITFDVRGRLTGVGNQTRVRNGFLTLLYVPTAGQVNLSN
ncbi:MAG: hypothetical protein AAGG07_09970 [Planctomycetota bacterium]